MPSPDTFERLRAICDRRYLASYSMAPTDCCVRAGCAPSSRCVECLTLHLWAYVAAAFDMWSEEEDSLHNSTERGHDE